MYLNFILGQAEATGGTSFFIMMIAMIAIFYFFMIRPQNKKQKELEEMRNNIKVGDAIITSGGIHGKVKEVKTSVLVIEIANNVNITVDKSSVFIETEAEKK